MGGALKRGGYSDIFSAPDHDHGRCASMVLARAEGLCVKEGLKLTPIRRRVLKALAGTHQPVGAYELIERLEDKNGKRPAPITVYRALDFLVENRLAHRIESRNAFVACAHDHGVSDVVMFLICERCGAAGEAVSAAVGTSLLMAAQAAGFRVHGQVIEVGGACRHCQAA